MYSKQMVFDIFFSSKEIPDNEIGGWLVRGHDEKDVYQEYIVKGEWSNLCLPPDDWLDWVRVPIEKGKCF